MYKKSWKPILLIVLFDALFFLSLFSAAKLFDVIFISNEQALVGSWMGYVLFFLYFAVVVLVYSFFKYCVVDFLDQWSGTQKKFDFSRLLPFIQYNMIVFFIFLAVSLTLTFFFLIALTPLLKQPALFVFSALILCFWYLFVQASHAIFFQRKEFLLSAIPKKALQLFSFQNIGKWLGWNLLYILVVFLLYLGLFFILKQVAQNPSQYTLFYLLNVILFIFLALASYLFVFWNRMYLYVVFSERKI